MYHAICHVLLRRSDSGTLFCLYAVTLCWTKSVSERHGKLVPGIKAGQVYFFIFIHQYSIHIANLSPRRHFTNRIEMPKLISVLVSLSLLLLFAGASLVSEQAHKELTSTISTRARALGIPSSQVGCILREVSSFRPMTQESKGMSDEEQYHRHVVTSLKTCIPNQLTTGKNSVRSYRPRRKGATRCGCRSGCHFCCLITALGGNDFCFRLHCNRAFMKGKTRCL